MIKAFGNMYCCHLELRLLKEPILGIEIEKNLELKHEKIILRQYTVSDIHNSTFDKFNLRVENHVSIGRHLTIECVDKSMRKHILDPHYGTINALIIYSNGKEISIPDSVSHIFALCEGRTICLGYKTT